MITVFEVPVCKYGGLQRPVANLQHIIKPEYRTDKMNY